MAIAPPPSAERRLVRRHPRLLPPGPGRFSPRRLAGLLHHLLLLSLIAVASWGLGSTLLGPLRLRGESPREAPLLEVGAGLGALALAVFIVSAAGILYRGVVLALLAAGALLRRRRRGIGALPEEGEGRWNRGEVALGVLPLLAGAMTLACSLAPPASWRDLVVPAGPRPRELEHPAARAPAGSGVVGIAVTRPAIAA